MFRSSDLIIEYDGCGASMAESPSAHTEIRISGMRVIESCIGISSCHTVITGNCSAMPYEEKKRTSDAVFRIVSMYMKKLGICRDCRIIFCGLGNDMLTADSLGTAVFRKIHTTGENGILPRVFAVRCGVPASTGIDSAEMIRSCAELVHADLIVTADSLCARFRERLCCVIQITDMGITPGSAFSRTSGEISPATMPCPVISLGVPTVIRDDVLLNGEISSDKPLLVSSADCDRVIEDFSSVIAAGLNRAFLGNISRNGI